MCGGLGCLFMVWGFRWRLVALPVFVKRLLILSAQNT